MSKLQQDMTQLIHCKRIQCRTILLTIVLLLNFGSGLQAQQTDSLLDEVTLRSAVAYAVKHQAQVRRLEVAEDITEANIRSRLSQWYPQVNFNFLLQHNFALPTTVISGNAIRTGLNNTSAGQFGGSQLIFSRDALLASRTRNDVRQQARQTTASSRIDVAADVAKAFYDVLAASQQINVARENIIRIERSLRDAQNQYAAGVADKIDYKRATITLNNSRASLRSNEELLKARKEYLKSLMGYPVSGELNIVYDTLAMEQEIALDTLQTVDYSARIEYRLLETQRSLLDANVRYNKWSYLPTASFNGGYNLNFLNDQFSELYGTSYPNSFAGLGLSIPIFQGGKRKYDLRAARLQLKQNDWDLTDLKNNINAQYAQALADYKGNLANYQALKENVSIAQEVYDVVQLQYRSGIKTYLEVVTSETDLRTAQINFYNALYRLLSSKVDVERALGAIRY